MLKLFRIILREFLSKIIERLSHLNFYSILKLLLAYTKLFYIKRYDK